MRYGLAGMLVFALVLGVVAGEGGETSDSPLQGEKFLEALDKNLNLKDKQKEKIKSVLEKSRAKDKKKIAELKKLKKRMQSLGKELKRSNQESREAIRQQLDLDQKERFDAMMQKMKRHHGRRGQRGQRGRGGKKDRRMRGIDMDPNDIPPELRQRMQRGKRDFPPEMRHKGGGGRDDLPPEMRRRVEELKEMRRRQGAGSQRDVPPSEEWNDRRMPFEGGSTPND